MKLAFCLFNYFPHGGLQRDFVRIARECQRRGASVRVYTLSWEGPVPDGFDVRIAPVRALSNHRRVDRFFRWLEKELRAFPDIGIVGFNKMPGLDLYYAADPCFKEKSLTRRGALYRLGPRYRLYAAFEEAVFGRHSRTEILMISKAQEPVFVKHYATPEQRMHFLPPNVSRERIAPPDASDRRGAFRGENGLADDDRLLVQIGSGFITKGVDRSIRALAALPEPVRGKTVLWVVGKDRSTRFERLARELGVADRVVFTGGRDDVSQILLGADLMIHPAYAENTGTVLIEAVAAGLPVLCTSVCGYSGHIEAADCGAVTPEPFEQSTLNGQLREILTSGDLATFGKNALHYAGTTDLYSMHEVAADVIFETLRKKNRTS